MASAMELRRANPSVPRKAAMSSDAVGAENGPVAAGVPIEFEDPNAVMVNEACKYCLFFLALGLFLSTIVAITILSSGKSSIPWSPMAVNITEIPDLEKICSLYDYGGHCFRHTTILMGCSTFTCEDVSTLLTLGHHKHWGVQREEKKLELHVPNGAVCADGKWCMHGHCVDAPDKVRTHEAFVALQTTHQMAKKNKSSACVRSTLGTFLEAANNLSLERHPDLKFCENYEEHKKKNFETLPLPAINYWSCNGPSPRKWKETPAFCVSFWPVTVDEGSLELCRHQHEFYLGNDRAHDWDRKFRNCTLNGNATNDGYKCNPRIRAVDMQLQSTEGICLAGYCVPIE